MVTDANPVTSAVRDHTIHSAEEAAQ
jgi:hypothetical protein